MERRFISVNEAAQYLGLHPVTVRRMIANKYLPVKRFPGRGRMDVVRIDLQELNRKLEREGMTPKART